jgi:hypothetical protein
MSKHLRGPDPFISNLVHKFNQGSHSGPFCAPEERDIGVSSFETEPSLPSVCVLLPGVRCPTENTYSHVTGLCPRHRARTPLGQHNPARPNSRIITGRHTQLATSAPAIAEIKISTARFSSCRRAQQCGQHRNGGRSLTYTAFGCNFCRTTNSAREYNGYIYFLALIAPIAKAFLIFPRPSQQCDNDRVESQTAFGHSYRSCC